MAGRKKDNQSYTASQLFNFTRDSYMERTTRPIYAIAFLLPFLAFYEIGTVLINTDVLSRSQVRVVAFVWLREFLQYLGTSDRIAWIAPPVVVVIILLGLQIASRKPWYFCLRDYGPMGIECILLAVPLIVLSLFFNSPTVGAPPSSPSALGPARVCTGVLTVQQPAVPNGNEPASGRAAGVSGPGRSLMANIVTGVGAGIYEELVFRLILICALMVLFQDIIGVGHQNAIVLSVLISAALFSAHHHIIFVDRQLLLVDQPGWGKFLFRTLAGVYFAILFAARGFGITAGTHAFYDIIATIINAVFFDA
ncbi:MAG: CPBP family intramembrane metalloprotease [Sedimentisphaerales bacterium]|nr:CPBP family intramembrane metalloprotease [Sedimentisphaerales bacterium]